MAKLRVLASAFACAPGGVSEQFGGGELILGWNVVNQLARFHDVWVLTHSLHRATIEKALPIQRSAVPHFVYLSLPSWLEGVKSFQGGIQFYAYLWQLRAYFEARRLHRQIRFDVFHHVTYANDWMASFIGALLPVPYLRGPGGGAHRTPQVLLKEYPLRARAWEYFRTFGQWVLRYDPFFVLGRRRARAILVCNQEALEAVPQKLRRKAHLFPVNGISGEDLQLLRGGAMCSTGGEDKADQGQPQNGTFHVLSAGKLLPLKGYALAIRAFAPFAKRHKEVELTIVGGGPEGGRLGSLVQELGLQGQVHLEEWAPRPKVLSAMKACEIFIFPSFRDGGGAVVVEAMAAGKPVICMDLAGPGMHVTENCGIKIPPRSPRETIELMTQALERLYGDHELRGKMGQAARTRAEQVYSWDHLGDRLLKIYEEVLGLLSHEA